MPFVSVFEGKRLVMFCMNNRYSDTSDDAFAPSSASCAFKSNTTGIASSAVLAAGLLSVIIAAFAAIIISSAAVRVSIAATILLAAAVQIRIITEPKGKAA